MEQLLRIKSIPIQYELKIVPAKLDYKSQTSQVNINRIKGGLHMESSPAKLNISTFNSRASMCPTTRMSIQQAAQKGKEAALNFTAQSSKEAVMLANSTSKEDTLGQIIRSHTPVSNGDFTLSFIPKTGPDIQYQEGSLDIQYQADKLEFDVRVSNGNLEYVPGDISMNVTQWPDVIIEYLGEPRYVPPRGDHKAFIARA